MTVTCTTNQYTIGGTVTGLAGTGLVLVNNGGDPLAISTNGAFTFPASVTSGQGYNVTVQAQPGSPWQTCTLTGASGGVGGANITNIAVTCSTNQYAVGGTVVGLAHSVTLQNNGGDSLTVSANGAFTFPTSLASGTSYAVTVSSQPTSPSQTCAVVSGTGSIAGAAITDVTVTCITNQYAIGGTVTGLLGTGMTLRNNGGDDLLVTADGVFTFATPIDSGTTYTVTIATQPSSPTQSCVLAGATGMVGGSAVTSVSINCTTNSYLVTGTVTGLFGTGLVIQNNGGGDLPISGSGTFSFAAPILSGQPFNVTVLTAPTNPWQTCTPVPASGTVGGANVNVTITCVSNPYNIAVAVTGLAGGGFVLQNNAGDNLPITGNATFMFATPVRSGLTYAVTVLSQPTNPWQTCTVTGPAGTVAGGPVTLPVTCVSNPYTVGGTVSGLNGSGLVLRNNGGNDLSISTNGAFTFGTPIASGNTYAVTVGTAPSAPAQNCAIANGSGTVGAGNVTNVAVTCTNVVICGTAAENGTMSLTCPAGQTISAIDFASYGTPNGACGGFATGGMPLGHQPLRRPDGLQRPGVVFCGGHQRQLR